MSLLIATNKLDVATLRLNDCEKHVKEIRTNSEDGLSVARNALAREAKHSPLVFVDDDVELSEELWNLIGCLPPRWREKYIYMSQGGNHPTSRVMILPQNAFNDIGGFDENIRYNGEDFDFYLRAQRKGYFVVVIPNTEIKHKPHKKSHWFNYHFEAPYVRIKHHKVGVNFFFYRNPIVMLLRIMGFLYYRLIKRTERYPVD